MRSKNWHWGGNRSNSGSRDTDILDVLYVEITTFYFFLPTFFPFPFIFLPPSFSFLPNFCLPLLTLSSYLYFSSSSFFLNFYFLIFSPFLFPSFILFGLIYLYFIIKTHSIYYRKKHPYANIFNFKKLEKSRLALPHLSCTL